MGGLRFGFMSMFMRLMAVARYRFIVELTVLFILVWTGCAVLIFAMEHGINPKVKSLGDAVYFLLVTMTTSGDSGVSPITVGGPHGDGHRRDLVEIAHCIAVRAGSRRAD